MNERQIEKTVDLWLEVYSLEEFLEKFNVTPFEVVFLAYEAGLIDEELLERYIPTDDS